mgnify:CR=1 FL=1
MASLDDTDVVVVVVGVADVLARECETKLAFSKELKTNATTNK